MPINIKLELLELLANDYPNWVNVRPLINKHRLENNFTRQDFSTLLYSLQDKKLIRTQNVIALSYHKQDVYDDESDITAKLEPDGLDEYYKLKNIYSPTPTSVTHNTINADNNSGNIAQSSFAPLRQEAQNSPKATPIKNEITSNQKTFWVKTLRYIGDNIVKIIVGIITAAILVWLGLKK